MGAPAEMVRSRKGLALAAGGALAMVLALGFLPAAEPALPAPLPGHSVMVRSAEPWALDYYGGLLGARPSSLAEAYYTDAEAGTVHVQAFTFPVPEGLARAESNYRLLVVGIAAPCAAHPALPPEALLCTGTSSHGPGGYAVLGRRGNLLVATLTHDPGVPLEEVLAYARRAAPP